MFASRAYIKRHGQPASVDELDRHALIGLEDGPARHRAAQWLARVAAFFDFVVAEVEALQPIHTG